MDEIIAFCGLLCQNCQIYLATREVNKTIKDKLIFEIINICKEHYRIDYKYEDINDCDGCTSENDKLFFGCAKCKIRKCAIEKGIKNCAYCEEYSCDELLNVFKSDPSAKTRLDLVRSTM